MDTVRKRKLYQKYGELGPQLPADQVVSSVCPLLCGHTVCRTLVNFDGEVRYKICQVSVGLDT